MFLICSVCFRYDNLCIQSSVATLWKKFRLCCPSATVFEPFIRTLTLKGWEVCPTLLILLFISFYLFCSSNSWKLEAWAWSNNWKWCALNFPEMWDQSKKKQQKKHPEHLTGHAPHTIFLTDPEWDVYGRSDILKFFKKSLLTPITTKCSIQLWVICTWMRNKDTNDKRSVEEHGHH